MSKILDKKSVPISVLKNWDRNPRSISKEGFERLKNQIKNLGVYAPLLVNEEMIVLSGNMRLRAYRELGVDPVEVWVVDAKDEKTMLEYALSANDRAGEYDEQQLAELISGVPDLDLELFHVDLGKTIDLSGVMNKFGSFNEKEVDENIQTDNKCPKCGYEW